MRYITATGYELEVGRVDRRMIDRAVVALKRPQPPAVKASDLGIEVFGGIDEDVIMHDDPDYQAALLAYYIKLATREFDILSEAVSIVAPSWREKARELEALGLVGGSNAKAGVLRYEALSDSEDWGAVVNEVIYNSTVSGRGVEEAQERFNVTWRGEPLSSIGIPRTPAMYSAEYEARRAAKHGEMSWPEFCALSGPDQSAEVVFYRSSGVLAWLEQR